MKKRQSMNASVLMGGACMIALLSACQSTPSATTPINYQGTAPDERSSNRNEIARVRTALAAQYIGERKLDAAKRQLETALQADSRYAPAYDMMGVLLKTEGSPTNLARADEYFRRAIGLDGKFMPARNNYGVYLSQIGNHQAAISQFEIAGSALGYEGRSRALENLGMTYKKIAQTAKAKEAFIRAIEADDGSIIARVELIHLFLDEGNMLFAKRLYDELSTMAGTQQQLPAEVLLQGIRIAILQGSQNQQQLLSQQLLSLYPLSDEAKRLKAWLSNPSKPLK